MCFICINFDYRYIIVNACEPKNGSQRFYTHPLPSLKKEGDTLGFISYIVQK